MNMKKYFIVILSLCVSFVMFGANLITKSKVIYRDYSVVRITHDKIYISHEEGIIGIQHADIPDFLLDKYQEEIQKKKKAYKNKIASLRKQKIINYISQTIQRANREQDDAKAIEILQNIIKEYPTHPNIGDAKQLLTVRRNDLFAGTQIKKAMERFDCAEALNLLNKIKETDKHKEKLKTLLALYKIAVDKKLSPLHIAVKCNDTSWIDILLEKGMSIDIAECGFTPLMLAIADRDIEEQIITHLISKGADVNAQSSDTGKTPLIVACSSRSVKIAKILLDAKADVNNVDFNMSSALFAAIARNDATTLKLVKLLMNHGADITLKNKQGLTVHNLTEKCDARRRYVLQVLLNKITFPNKTKVAVFDGNHFVINWQMTQNDLRANNLFAYSGFLSNSLFDVYEGSLLGAGCDKVTARFHFHKKNKELVKVILFDSADGRKYWSKERYANRMNTAIKHTADLFKKAHDNVEYINNLPTEYKDGIMRYKALIAPFKAVVLFRIGYSQGAQFHISNIVVVNPAYFPADKDYFKEYYKDL